MNFTQDYLEGSLKIIHQTLDALRPVLMGAYGKVDYREKHDNTIVTELDELVETKLKAALQKFDPSVGFWGEEDGQRGSKDHFWLVDPIDGTEHFARGIPFCTNMAAFISGGEPQASVINNFVTDEYYSAIKGMGATKNGQTIQVSKRPLNRSFITVVINFNNPANLKQRQKLLDNVGGLPNFYCSGATYAFLAEGKLDGRIVSESSRTYIWDVAPGALLVSEAGGKVVNWGKENYDYRHINTIASNAVIFDELAKLMS